MLGWTNSRDKNFGDVVVELQIGDGFFDWNLSDQQETGGEVWGSLKDASGKKTWDPSYPGQGDGANGAWGGNYVVTIARVGSNFIVDVQIFNNGARTLHATWASTIATGAGDVRLVGNPFFVDDLVGYLGTPAQA